MIGTAMAARTQTNSWRPLISQSLMITPRPRSVRDAGRLAETDWAEAESATDSGRINCLARDCPLVPTVFPTLGTRMPPIDPAQACGDPPLTSCSGMKTSVDQTLQRVLIHSGGIDPPS